MWSAPCLVEHEERRSESFPLLSLFAALSPIFFSVQIQKGLFTMEAQYGGTCKLGANSILRPPHPVASCGPFLPMSLAEIVLHSSP